MKKIFLCLVALLALAGCYKDNDAMLGTWVRPSEKNPSFTEGFMLKRHGKAVSVNLGSLKYEKWHVTEGTLVLTGKDSGAGFPVDVQDMYTIESVNDLMLVLTSLGGDRLYYTRQK